MRTNLDDPQPHWISGVEGGRVLAAQETTLEAKTNEEVSVPREARRHNGTHLLRRRPLLKKTYNMCRELGHYATQISWEL